MSLKILVKNSKDIKAKEDKSNCKFLEIEKPVVFHDERVLKLSTS